ncbi:MULTISPECIES: ABC transporter ATP-binding protein [unclassified Caulobacter]|uniref:ABC transporter ATP-binding protein n=1 Tax=unclassified Caulobacter TaxID=2648921 RepID=UPI000D393EB4|nr:MULTISPECIES: ABC transporter ATP-binding protein [unclassified Caulobacter]PTS91046.1 ABC transporter ATP-binding protein [Caulobacter sp. HMWF009]PTT05506.1 ABC transporter ATP-binding protein [Caulobacter sp. HMWF025]
MTAADGLLTVSDVRHAYDGRSVLQGVDLTLNPGEIYALLGANGAGKTTLIRTLCGRLKPDAGTVRLNGQDPARVPSARAVLGLVPQEIALYPHLTVSENLATFASLAQVPRAAVADAVQRAMSLTRILDRAHVPVRHLSGGYQRRTNIAAAIVHQPRLLILDEPTVGVDIDARAALDSVIRGLRDLGVAILMTTHDLDQAGGLADRVGFLKAGRLVLEGAPAALLASAFGERMELVVQLSEAPNPEAAERLGQEGLAPVEQRADLWARLDSDGYESAGLLHTRLQAIGLRPREIRVRAPSLHHLFSQVTDGTVAG